MKTLSRIVMPLLAGALAVTTIGLAQAYRMQRGNVSALTARVVELESATRLPSVEVMQQIVKLESDVTSLRSENAQLATKAREAEDALLALKRSLQQALALEEQSLQSVALSIERLKRETAVSEDQKEKLTAVASYLKNVDDQIVRLVGN